MARTNASARRRAYAPTRDYADMAEVAERISAMPDEYAVCYGGRAHRWPLKPDTSWVDPETFAITQRETCETCGTEKTSTHAFGERTRTSYKRPDGYGLAGLGGLTSDARSLVHMEAVYRRHERATGERLTRPSETRSTGAKAIPISSAKGRRKGHGATSARAAAPTRSAARATSPKRATRAAGGR